MLNVKSPVTGNFECIEIDKIQSKEIINLYADYYNQNVSRFFEKVSQVIIIKCQRTGYRFYHPTEIMGDGLFYEQLQKEGEKSGTAYYRSNTFDQILSLQRINKGERVLEIGCGNGSFMKMLINQKNIHVTGLELNNYAVEKCKKEGLDTHNLLIEDFEVHHKNEFDAVCSFQVLEHVYAIKSFIESSLEVLKSGGQLIISVPDCSPYAMRHDKYAILNLPPHHVGLWNRETFEKLTTIFPLELIDVQYSEQISIKGDVYYRIKNWIRIKTVYGQHSLSEKLAMYLLLPFAFVLAVVDKFNGKINGGQICVIFKKK